MSLQRPRKVHRTTTHAGPGWLQVGVCPGVQMVATDPFFLQPWLCGGSSPPKPKGDLLMEGYFQLNIFLHSPNFLWLNVTVP